MRFTLLRPVSCVALAVFPTLSGCGGGGVLSPSHAATSAPQSSARVTATIKIPNAAATQSTRRRVQYFSPATQSATISVNGGTPASVNLTPSSPNCSTGAGGTVCIVSLNALIGTDTFAVILYDGLNGSGNVLSSATVTQAIVNGPNNINLITNGVLNNIVIGLSQSAFTVGTPASIMVSVMATDPDGDTIVGPGNFADASGDALTVHLTDTDTSGATTLTPSSITAPATGVTLTYTGALLLSATISAMVSGGTIGGTVMPAGLVANQTLWVGNESSNSVTAYVPGTNTTIGADTITGLSCPYGVAIDTSGKIWVANGCTYSVQAFIQGTSTPIAADTITTGLNGPVGLAFDTSGNLWVTNANSNTIMAYVPGTNTPIAADTITASLYTPYGIAFDANGHLWVANINNNTVTAYVPGTNTPIAGDMITGLNGPSALAFDSSGHLWVANEFGNTVMAYVPGTNTPIAADTISAGLDAPSALAFDLSGRLWVLNALSNTITVYVPGTNTPIAADMINVGLSGSQGMAFWP